MVLQTGSFVQDSLPQAFVHHPAAHLSRHITALLGPVDMSPHRLWGKALLWFTCLTGINNEHNLNFLVGLVCDKNGSLNEKASCYFAFNL